MNTILRSKLENEMTEKAYALADHHRARMLRRMTEARADYRARKIAALGTWADCAIKEWTRAGAARIAAGDRQIAASFYLSRVTLGVVWQFDDQPAYTDPEWHAKICSADAATPIGTVYDNLITLAAQAIAGTRRDTIKSDSGALACAETGRRLRAIYAQPLMNGGRDFEDLDPASQLARLRADLRAVKWPYGATSYYYFTADGATLSPAAVRDNYREIREALKTNDRRSGWYVIGADLNFEDPDLYCDHTGARIPAEYEATENENI